MLEICLSHSNEIHIVEDVAEALMYVFCRMGFPDVILSENGSQLISLTMRSFTDMLSIAQMFSSRHHPQSHSVIENFHTTLKHMLAKVTAEFPHNWDM